MKISLNYLILRNPVRTNQFLYVRIIVILKGDFSVYTKRKTEWVILNNVKK